MRIPSLFLSSVLLAACGEPAGPPSASRAPLQSASAGEGEGESEGESDVIEDGEEEVSDAFPAAASVRRHLPVQIGSPHAGLDFTTDAPVVSLSGAVLERPERLHWASTTGDSGEAALEADSWSAEVPIALGDQTVTVTATFADGLTQADEVVIHGAERSTLSGPILTSTSRMLDVHTDESIGVRMAGEGQLVVGPDDGAEGLAEVWATLTCADGLCSGRFPAPDALGWHSFRLQAEDGTTSGSFTVEVAASPTLEQDAEMSELMAVAGTAFHSADTPEEGLEAAYRLLVDAGVSDIAIDLTHGPTLSWLDPAGDPILLAPPAAEGTRGMPASAPPPMGPVSPTTASTRALVLAPYFSTDFAGWDESQQVAQGFTDSDCPAYTPADGHGQILYADEASKDLALWEKVLSTDFVHISTHGDWTHTPYGMTHITTTGIVYQVDVPPEAIARNRGRGRLLGRPRCELDGTCDTWREVMLVPRFFTDHAPSEPVNGIVYFSSCRSAMGTEMLDTLVAHGAAAVVGYTEIVSSSFARTDALAFWADVQARERVSDAAARFSTTPDDAVTPAVAWVQSRGEVRAAHGTIVDTSFGGDLFWERGGNAPVTYLPPGGGPGLEPAVDGDGLLMQLSPTAGYTYAELGVEVCPVEGEWLRVRADVQVAASPYGSPSTEQDNFFIVRLDEADRAAHGTSTLDYWDWSEVRSRSSLSEGSYLGTGWQELDATLVVPAPAVWEGRMVRLATGGWDAWSYAVGIDAVEITVEGG